MKTIINKGLVSLLVFALALSSCTDSFLNTPTQSEFSDDVVFSNATLADGALAAVYQEMMENRSYRNRLTAYMGVNTDIELKTGSKDGAASSDRKTMAIYMASSQLGEGFQDADGKDPYSRIYNCIERANLVIQGIEKYGNINTDKELAAVYGEALTIRAFLYYDLIKIWGDVPVRWEPVTAETIYLERTDRAIIYDHILADLAVASPLIPWAGEATRTGTVERISKGFAKGLRARIALSAGGYRQRGNQLEAPDATRRRAMYEIAKQECWDVIESGKHSLSLSFEQVFRDQCADITTIGRESIYELPFNNSRGEWLSYVGLRHDVKDKYTKVVVKGEVGPNPTLLYDYDENDIRRDVTIAPYKWVADQKQVMTKITTLYFGKWRAEWMAREMPANDDGVNFMVMRYADILLMYAEAVNELEGPSNAKEYLKRVRRRAFDLSLHSQKVDAYVDAAATKEAFFTLIVDERAFEFCGEIIRKWDLMRWGLLGSKLRETRAKMLELNAAAMDYSKSYRGKPVSRDIWWKLNTNANQDKILEMKGFKTSQIYQDADTTDMKAAGYTRQKFFYDQENEDAPTVLMDDAFVQKSVFQCADPDKAQHLPIMDIILKNSNGKLSN